MNKRTIVLAGVVLTSSAVAGYAWRVVHPRVVAAPSFLAQQSVAAAGPVRPKPISDVHWIERDGVHGVEFTAEEIGTNYLFLFKPWVPPASELYALDDPQTAVYVELHHDYMGMQTTYVMANTSGVFSTTIPTSRVEHSFFQTFRVLAWASGADTSDPSQAFFDHDMTFAMQ